MKLAKSYLKAYRKKLVGADDINPISVNSSIGFHYMLTTIVSFLGVIKKLGDFIGDYERFEEDNHYQTSSLKTEDKEEIKIRYKKNTIFEEQPLALRQWVINLSTKSLQYKGAFYTNNKLQEWNQQDNYNSIEVYSRYHPLIESTFHQGVIDILTVIDFLLHHKIKGNNIKLLVDHEMENLALKTKDYCIQYNCQIEIICQQKWFEAEINNAPYFFDKNLSLSSKS